MQKYAVNAAETAHSARSRLSRSRSGASRTAAAYMVGRRGPGGICDWCMRKRSIEFVTLALALVLAGGCKGRTAAWEDKETKPPTGDGASDGGGGGAATSV